MEDGRLPLDKTLFKLWKRTDFKLGKTLFKLWKRTDFNSTRLSSNYGRGQISARQDSLQTMEDGRLPLDKGLGLTA